MSEFDPASDLPPLKISCTSSRCTDGLHCFKQKYHRNRVTPRGGPCRSCGTDLVDFDRVHQRRPDDVGYTFEALRRELIRHHFWHVEIDETARNHALRKGRAGLLPATEARIRSSVGKSSARLPRDGQQTPFTGNVIYYAQHATACCCRKCIEYWHDIPRDRDLTEEEVGYLTDLAWRYIMERMPDLPEERQKVPSRRRKRP